MEYFTRNQWQYLYDQARQLPSRVGDHPTCNEVRNWLAQLLENDGYGVDQYNQIVATHRCADCGRVIPAGQQLCDCNTSGDLG